MASVCQSSYRTLRKSKKSRKGRNKQRCNVARAAKKVAVVRPDIEDLQPAKTYDELMHLLEEDLNKFLPERYILHALR